MRKNRLKYLIFMALCCDLGLFTKRLIAPAANIITDSLHIPGGVATAFSLMFLVIAAALLPPRFGYATLMGAVQSVIALAMGMVGSMGILAPLGYIMPGVVIDCVLAASRKLRLPLEFQLVIANALAGMTASLTANLIVFRLHGLVLLVYLSVATTCGAICGLLAGWATDRLRPVLRKTG